MKMRVISFFKMKKPETRRDWILTGAKVALIGGVLALIGFLLTVQATSQPTFCRSCHIMEPYYQAWTESKHKNIPCTDCHMTPGFAGTWRAKLQGLSQMVKYVTGTQGTRPWAEIEDASCLRSGCHETRLLQGRDDFNGVHFDHTPHLTLERRGKKLRCTSCHSQIVMGEHITVTTSACILCHFKNQPVDKPVGGCLGCHDVPTDTIQLPGGRQYVHANVVDRGVSCISCHASVTKGDGFVPKQRCFVCHNFPVDQYLDDHEFLHDNHVTKHKVECTACHEEITHGYESRRRQATFECTQCHEDMHSSQIALAEGTAASELGETQPRVGAMLAARVECIACHTGNLREAHSQRGVTHIGENAACIKCHGQGAESLLPQWRAFFAKRIAEVDRAIRSSRAPRDQIVRARNLVDLVRFGKGVHNNDLSRDLLAEAERIALGRAVDNFPAGPQSASSGCFRCHVEGAPTRSFRFGRMNFVHAPHTVRAQIACEKCHEDPPATFPNAVHGRVRIEQKDCVSCHHWQRLRCEKCHGRGPEQPIAWRGLRFPHAPHGTNAEACFKCHRADPVNRRMQTITSPSTCQGCHHKVGNRAACTACHTQVPQKTFTIAGRTFPHAAHTPAKGLTCSQCHTITPQGIRATANCSSCHHKAGANCAPCHQQGPAQPVSFRQTRFPHASHVANGMGCDDCHKAQNGRMRVDPGCPMCHHASGMKPECAGCHGNGPAGTVPTRWQPFEHAKHIPLGMSCGDCHKADAPEQVTLICATCHDEVKAALEAPAAGSTP